MSRPVKNFLWMLAASLVLFLLLSYIDEYETLVAPMLREVMTWFHGR